LKEIEPDISSLDYLEPGLLFADIGLPEMIPANLMGGGIAKCLSVAIAMLYSRDSIVLIDEIEDGLHYMAQQNMWKAILEWARKLNVQVFVTTHSNESIKTFNNSIDTTLFESETKLFRIERKDEKFRSVEYTKELLTESLESKWEVR
jgi:AAA15 family ATPase/GTPase